MSMWFSTHCLNSFSAPRCFKHVFQITYVNHAAFFWLALPSRAPNLRHGGQPWHVHCILGYIYAMHFVLQETTRRWWGMVSTTKWLPTMLQFLFQAPPNPGAPARPAKAGPPDILAWNLVSKNQIP
jgi:hypothetical protein